MGLKAPHVEAVADHPEVGSSPAEPVIETSLRIGYQNVRRNSLGDPAEPVGKGRSRLSRIAEAMIGTPVIFAATNPKVLARFRKVCITWIRSV